MLNPHIPAQIKDVILNNREKIKTTAADFARPLWTTVTWIHEHGDKTNSRLQAAVIASKSCWRAQTSMKQRISPS